MSTRPTLLVVVASVRRGRVGGPVADWYAALARGCGLFDVAVADLRDGPAYYDDPDHPGYRRYSSQPLRELSAAVAGADALAVVSAEYNYFLPAPLLNAFQSMYLEWGYLPLGLVTYGGVSGGLRAAQTIRTMASTLLMFTTETSVAVPHVTDQVDGPLFTPRDSQATAAAQQLGELAELVEAFATLRARRRAGLTPG